MPGEGGCQPQKAKSRPGFPTVDGAAYLPVRAVADSLGLGVEWDAKTQTVKLTTGGSSGDALSEQAYKNKILEIGDKVAELSPSVSAAQQKVDELTAKLSRYQTDAQKLTQGIAEVMGN